MADDCQCLACRRLRGETTEGSESLETQWRRESEQNEGRDSESAPRWARKLAGILSSGLLYDPDDP